MADCKPQVSIRNINILDLIGGLIIISSRQENTYYTYTMKTYQFESIFLLFGIFLPGARTQSFTNVALGKETSQTSTNWDGPSHLAVDGNTDGNYKNDSVTHTDEHSDGEFIYWKVDLGGSYLIDRIAVYHRDDINCADVFTGDCKKRSQGFIVEIQDENGSVMWNWQHQTSVVTESPKFLLVNPLALGNSVWVKLMLDGQTIRQLSLAEVEVYGEPEPTTAQSIIQSNEPSRASELFPKVQAINYDVQSGTQLVGGDAYIGHFDNNDYLTYNSLNFGPSGTTKSVELRYAKRNNGSKLELRIGGPTGTLIGEYSPAKTGGWNTFTTVYIEIDDVIGIQDLTLVGKGGSGVMNIDWFELSA